MIQAKGLKHQYGKGTAGIAFPDIEVEAGGKMLLLGDSGCGKSTLLNLLGGLMRPQHGQVRIGDTQLSHLSNNALDKFRGQNIGIIFQQPHFVRALKVNENLALTQRLAGKKVDKQRIASLLQQLGLGHKLSAKPQHLSQGEKQRMAIARALVNEPKVVLADEPTSALDDQNTLEVIRLLEQQAERYGATLLIVTHDNRLKEHFENRIEL